VASYPALPALFFLRRNSMSEDKATPSKRTTKKPVAVSEAVKPKKAATPKAKPAVDAAAASAPVVAKKAAAKVTDKVAAEPAKAKKATAPAAAKVVAAKPAAAKKKAPAASKLVDKPAAPSEEERQRWIATAAYHRAEKRGFAPGYDEQDWFDAVAEIDALVGKA
jgi:hypothetical protein